MKPYPPAKVRNVALVGHGGSGKTMLTEALLLCSGATNRAGRVEDGTTVSDFEPETLAALSVADLAVLVVSAVDGVEVQTEIFWKAAAELGIPRLIFMNKLDRERADFPNVLQQLHQSFGAGVAPLELPIGEEHDFHGIADLLTDSAFIYEAGKCTASKAP